MLRRYKDWSDSGTTNLHYGDKGIFSIAMTVSSQRHWTSANPFLFPSSSLLFDAAVRELRAERAAGAGSA